MEFFKHRGYSPYSDWGMRTPSSRLSSRKITSSRDLLRIAHDYNDVVALEATGPVSIPLG